MQARGGTPRARARRRRGGATSGVVGAPVAAGVRLPQHRQVGQRRHAVPVVHAGSTARRRLDSPCSASTPRSRPSAVGRRPDDQVEARLQDAPPVGDPGLLGDQLLAVVAQLVEAEVASSGRAAAGAAEPAASPAAAPSAARLLGLSLRTCGMCRVCRSITSVIVGASRRLEAGHPYGRDPHGTVGWRRAVAVSRAAAARRTETPARADPARPADQPDPRQTYPDAHCELDFTNPLELLVATILSAQTTDVRVNMVTPTLFAKYRTRCGLRRRRPGRAGDADPVHRVLPGQDELADRAGPGTRASGTAARCPAARKTWSRCPASAARRPTSCWATRSACPASRSTRTSAGWPAGSAGPTETDPVKVEAEVGALFPKARVDDAQPPADLARPAGLPRPQAGVRRVPDRGAVPVVRRGRDRPGEGARSWSRSPAAGGGVA